jgi:hypothetical protein
MCDFGFQEDKKALGNTYFKREGFKRERIRIFLENLLAKNHHSFEISGISLVIKEHLLFSRG